MLCVVLIIVIPISVIQLNVVLQIAILIFVIPRNVILLNAIVLHVIIPNASLLNGISLLNILECFILQNFGTLNSTTFNNLLIFCLVELCEIKFYRLPFCQKSWRAFLKFLFSARRASLFDPHCCVNQPVMSELVKFLSLSNILEPCSVHIFSSERPFYERAVSNLVRPMHRSLWF